MDNTVLPKFSVIIPTLNRPELLQRALQSVTSQTYTNWEIIVVDDGSYPRANTSLQPFFTDPRIAYCWQSCGGPGLARKKGAALATGDFVCFLDDDDYYLPEHFSVVCRAILNGLPEAAILATGMLRKTVNGKTYKEHLYSSGHALNAYWSAPHSLLPFVFSRSIVSTHPIITVKSPIEDFEWLCGLLSDCPLTQIDTYTVVYVDHATNRTTTLNDKTSLYAREAVLFRLYQRPSIRKTISHQRYLEMVTHQRLHWTRQCIRERQWKKAIYGFSRGIKSAQWANAREIVYTIYVALKTF
ncbi:glycosyl transferase family 2 [Neolewinella xylanilytica]|uniref:Glycosyl transferase family 2 n=1 Tax=Neolewinella xylanilytica TaxID=1514080 RepID=A0A2S6I0H9_9BACT|nr:glycosyltransferase family A protein [Neolewinella xylanilytica]PPK84373.1 glycosyl transferase family 2 [Neolewinella xylanilytica]